MEHLFTSLFWFDQLTKSWAVSAPLSSFNFFRCVFSFYCVTHFPSSYQNIQKHFAPQSAFSIGGSLKLLFQMTRAPFRLNGWLWELPSSVQCSRSGRANSTLPIWGGKIDRVQSQVRCTSQSCSPVVKNPFVNAGDMGLIPDLGRFHMLQSN